MAQSKDSMMDAGAANVFRRIVAACKPDENGERQSLWIPANLAGVELKLGFMENKPKVCPKCGYVFYELPSHLGDYCCKKCWRSDHNKAAYERRKKRDKARATEKEQQEEA